MVVRAPWFALLLTMAGAPAFIFVPQRGDFAASWTVPGLPDGAWIRSDLDANLYLAHESEVSAYASGDGERLWTYKLPYDFRQVDGVLPADRCVLVVGRNTTDPTQAHLICLEAEPDAHGQSRMRWFRRALRVPENGLYVPLQPDREQGDYGFAALVTDGQLALLSLTDGEPLATMPIGDPLAAPVWDGLNGFLAVGPQAEVLRLRLGDAPEISEHRALPAATSLRGLRWDPRERRLFVDAGSRMFVLEFVFIPNRGEEQETGLLTVEESDQAIVGSSLDQVYVARGNRLEAMETRTGQSLWSFTMPAGTVIRETPVASQELVVVVGRAADDKATVIGLSTVDGSQLWQQSGLDLVTNGFRLPVLDDGRQRGVVGLLEQGNLEIIAATTAEKLAERRLGTFAGEPLWLDDSGFILTTDGDPSGAAPGPAVVGFDLLATGQRDDPSLHWVWPLPAGETVQSLQWLETGRLLVIQGRQSSYVFD